MFDFSNYLKIKKILRKENPDIVMTHNLKGISYLIPALIRKLGIKHIHTLHDIQLLHPSGLMIWSQENKVNGFFAKAYSKINKILFASPDVIISPSKWLLEEHNKKRFFQKSKQKILLNPIKKETHSQEEASFNTSSANLTNKRICHPLNNYTKFLYIGQIEEHKGALFLIKVFNKFSKQNNKIKLLIAGDGSKLSKAKKISINNKNIEFLGKINSQEVEDVMKQADYLIVPSLCYENSPTVIYEAISVGLPVIASRLGGIPELLNSEYLFEPGSKKDLINKMKQVIESKNIFQAGSNKKALNMLTAKEYINKLLNSVVAPQNIQRL